MTAFAIPIGAQPSAIEVLGQLTKESLSKVPKGKIPTGIPNSTLTYVEAAAAAQILTELYGADFDVEGYINQVNEKLRRFEPVTETYIDQIIKTTEKTVPVEGEKKSYPLPKGEVFDIRASWDWSTSNSDGGSESGTRYQWLRNISGEFIAPYLVTASDVHNAFFSVTGQEWYNWGYTTSSGREQINTLGSRWSRKTWDGYISQRTTTKPEIVLYPVGSSTPFPWTTPDLKVEFETTVINVPRTRTIWQPVIPLEIPIPLIPPIETSIETSIETTSVEEITTEVDPPVEVTNPIEIVQVTVAETPIVQEIITTVEPTLKTPLPVEIVPQFDLEVSINQPIIDISVDMTVPLPPTTPDPATTPLPPNVFSPENTISISDPFLPPREVDGNGVNSPIGQLNPTEQKAREESIEAFERVNFANPPISGIPAPIAATKANACQLASNPCQAQLDTGIQGNQKRLDDQTLQLDRLLNGAGAVGQVIDLAVLNRIDAKLGAQIPGGIGGFLGKMSNRMKLPEIFNFLAFLATLHNAAMLSKNLATTLGDVATLSLNVVGLKDEDGNPHNVNEILGGAANSWMEKLIGEEVWNDTKDTWKRANRVYQTAANIVYSVGSMVDSARSIGEWTGENLGKIGNALKSAGVVAESAYNWMPEQINAASGRTRALQKVRDGLNEADSAVSAFGSVVSEVSSIQTEVQEMKKRQEEFQKGVEELKPRESKDNGPVKEREEKEESDNQSAEYTRADLQPAG